MRGLLLPLALSLAVLAAPARGQAGEGDPPPDTVPSAPAPSQQPATAGPVEAERVGVSPAGAMLRSIALPGWGQVASGNPWRGGAYFVGHVTNVTMLVVTRGRLEDARERAGERARLARDSILEVAEADTALARLIEENPDTLAALVGRDREVRRLRGLTSARQQQQEDWIVWGAFWVLMSGVDAFVSAHLADFPADVRVEPLGRLERGVRLALRVPLGAP